MNVTLLKYRLDAGFKDLEQVFKKVDKEIGKIVKIEIHPLDNLSIKINDIESVENQSVKKGWVYLYCDVKEVVKEAKDG